MKLTSATNRYTQSFTGWRVMEHRMERGLWLSMFNSHAIDNPWCEYFKKMPCERIIVQLWADTDWDKEEWWDNLVLRF